MLRRSGKHDRGEDLDLALAVENYLTRSRRVVTRRRGEEELGRFELAADPRGDPDPDDVINEDSTICVFTEPWVSIPRPITDLRLTRKLTFRLPSWDVSSSDPPAEYHGS